MLDWTAPIPLHLQNVDVVLGSDLVWDEESACALITCVERLMASRPASVFLLSFVERSAFLKQHLLDTIQSTLMLASCEELKFDDGSVKAQRVWLLTITHKQ